MQSDAMKKVREAALDLLDWFDGPSMDLEGPDGMGARFARLRAALDAEPDPPAGFAGAERWLYEYSEPLTDGKLRQSIRWVLHRIKTLEADPEPPADYAEPEAVQNAREWIDAMCAVKAECERDLLAAYCAGQDNASEDDAPCFQDWMAQRTASTFADHAKAAEALAIEGMCKTFLEAHPDLKPEDCELVRRKTEDGFSWTVQERVKPPAGLAEAGRWLYEYSEPLTDGKLRQSIRWVLHRLKDLERNQAGGLSEEDAAFLEQVAGDWVDSVPDEDTYTAYARRQDAARLRAIAARARQEGDHA